MNVLAIDVGSSSVKAALVDAATCAIIGPIAKQAYSLDHPVTDAAEVPVSRIWEAVLCAVRKVTVDGAGDSVAGVGFSCMTPALVLLDDKDQPLLPAWTHLDRRARDFARRIWDEHGKEFLEFAGNRPLPGGISAVCFGEIARTQSDKIRAVRSYLHLNGWLAFHLSGEKFFDTANASFTGVYPTVSGGDWSGRWCEIFGVDRRWLPPVVGGDRTAGSLRPAIAKELGVPAGIPVKLGTADTTASMLALEMTPQDLLHGIGTTQVLLQIVDKPQPAEERLTRRLGVGESFVHVTHNPVGGAALEWMRELCFNDQPKTVFYGSTVAEAAARQTSVKLDPLYLGGDRLKIGTSHAAFTELSLWTTREDLLTALVDGMRRGHEKAWKALGGSPKTKRIFLTGGGAPTIQRLLYEKAGFEVHLVEQGALRGVGRLFRETV